MSSKPQNRGLVKRGTDDAVVVNLPYPKLRDDYILVRTIAVALNPADWQDLGEDFKSGSKPLLMGCDYAGIVEAVGKDVKKDLKKGDRVLGFAHGSNEINAEDGAFAEYIVAKGDVAILMPPYMSFSNAATLPCALGTVALGLYIHLEIPLPPATVPSGSWLFVYGGSSTTGSMAIQFAKLSGFKVVTTCSPQNFDLVQRFGADYWLDYRDPQCAQKVKEITADDLTLVLDTIDTPETAKLSAEAMSSSKGGIYCNLMGVDSPREDVKSVFFLGYTALGEAYIYDGQEWPIVEKDYEFVKSFMGLAEQILADRKIVPHPAGVRSGGLEGIHEGLDDLKQKRVSGEKLVYIIGDENN